MLLFFDYRAEGVENVPLTGGVILASNHQSHLDPVMLRVPLDRPIGYVARRTLFGSKVFAAVIRYLGAMSFDRASTGAHEMKSLVAVFQGGAAMIFFPEGTRSPDGELKALRPGIALLAKQAGVPVVPVAVEGTYACWPRRRKLFRPGRVRIVYGEPVVYGRKDRRNEILEDLTRRIAELAGRARQMC